MGMSLAESQATEDTKMRGMVEFVDDHSPEMIIHHVCDNEGCQLQVEENSMVATHCKQRELLVSEVLYRIQIDQMRRLGLQVAEVGHITLIRKKK